MEEEINELMAKLKFTEEESKRVFCLATTVPEVVGYEAWAVGMILSEEKINKEAMYRVF